MKLNQQISLPDGRRLGYDEHGPPDGKPLFYFHGAPSSRLEFNLFSDENLLQSLNARAIAVDRPGMGLSDFQPNRRLLDWHQDVVALANHLNIKRFSILAYSLGGPYGAACAFSIPSRLLRVGILSGAALFTQPELIENVNKGTRQFLFLPRDKPWASRLFLELLRAMVRFAPNRFVAQATSLLPAPDREIVVQEPAFQKQFVAMVREALRQDTRGAFHESLLTITAWDFHLQEIQMPVMLWHGEQDRNIPEAMARYMANTIPRCDAKFFPHEGHLSLFKKNAAEIIGALVN